MALKPGPTTMGLASLHGDEVMSELLAFENAMAVLIMCHDHVPKHI